MQCPVVLYLSSQADEVEAEEGGTGVPSESSGHTEVSDAEDGLSVNQILAPQSDGEAGATRFTLPMPEMDKERLESQELQDDSKGNGAHNRALARSVAQLASKARATPIQDDNSNPQSTIHLQMASPVPRLAPVTPRAPGRLHRDSPATSSSGP